MKAVIAVIIHYSFMDPLFRVPYYHVGDLPGEGVISVIVHVYGVSVV